MIEIKIKKNSVKEMNLREFSDSISNLLGELRDHLNECREKRQEGGFEIIFLESGNIILWFTQLFIQCVCLQQRAKQMGMKAKIADYTSKRSILREAIDNLKKFHDMVSRSETVRLGIQGYGDRTTIPKIRERR